MVSAWVDASLQNRDDGKSTQGMVIGVTDRRIMDGHLSPLNLAHWSSTKIERMCRSPGREKAESQAAEIPGVVVTDSKNVFDRLRDTIFVLKGAEKRISVELMALKEAQTFKKVAISGVHSDAQLADSLTKTHWKINEDEAMRSARNRKQTRSSKAWAHLRVRNRTARQRGPCKSKLEAIVQCECTHSRLA